MTIKEVRALLKSLGIEGTSDLKSYEQLYGTRSDMFAFDEDSVHFCVIDEHGRIKLNTKYFGYTKRIIEYNEQINLKIKQLWDLKRLKYI